MEAAIEAVIERVPEHERLRARTGIGPQRRTEHVLHDRDGWRDLRAPLRRRLSTRWPAVLLVDATGHKQVAAAPTDARRQVAGLRSFFRLTRPTRRVGARRRAVDVGVGGTPYRPDYPAAAPHPFALPRRQPSGVAGRACPRVISAQRKQKVTNTHPVHQYERVIVTAIGAGWPPMLARLLENNAGGVHAATASAVGLLVMLWNPAFPAGSGSGPGGSELELALIARAARRAGLLERRRCTPR
jgi:hypothetical protein